MSESAAPTVVPPVGAPKSKVLPILVGLNSLLLVGVLGVLAMTLLKPHGGGGAAAPPAEAKGEHGEGHSEEAKPESTAALGGPGPTVRLADFVVKLRNPEADRYARMAFELEVATDKDKEEMTARSPQARDAFIAYLSDRTSDELRGSEGLDRVKAELLKRVIALAPGIHVRALYLTEFVVQ